jgi:electron transfer flavoprotein-quinone oxidoreductase
MKIMPKEIYSDGLLITGEAANLLLNSGKAIQGMDYALHSGILAAETIVEAKQAGDFTSTTLKKYRDKLEDSFILKDMRKFQDAVHFLHSKEMFENVPSLVCDFGKQFFTIKNEPTPKTREMLTSSIKKHSGYWQLLKLGLKGAKSL